MSFKRFFGIGGGNGGGSREPQRSQQPVMREVRGAAGSRHEEREPTFEFVDEGNEPEPVFEEVAGNRTEALARKVLDAKATADQAILDRQAGKGKPFALELALRALAQAKVEQAQHNLRERKGTREQVVDAVQLLRRAEAAFERSEDGAEALARYRAEVVAGGGVDVGGESALQIEMQRRKQVGDEPSYP